MRINFVIRGLSVTGGVHTFVEISNRLVKRGHDVSITTLYRNQLKLPLLAKLNEPPLRAATKVKRELAAQIGRFFLGDPFRVPQPHYHPYFKLCEMAEIAELIPDCDINVATEYSTALPVYMSQKGLGIYYLQHYELLFVPPGVEYEFDRMIARDSYVLPLVKIGNSTWLRDQIYKNFGQRIPVINHAINHDVFYRRSVEKTYSKRRILCLGRSARWKGFEDALAAMKVVFRERQDVDWIVFGSEPSLPYHDHEAPYKYISNVSDNELALLYSSSDIVFSPSWYESFPAPPLEAMACGAPVVTTSVGTEDYAVNEENALIVPPRKPELMAQAILRLLDDKILREKLSSNGIHTAKQFTWERTTDRIEALFQRELARG